MKFRLLKHPFFILIAAACFFYSCSKTKIVPTNTNYNTKSSGTSGTTGNETSTTDTAASFNEPTGLAVDAAGNIYVADYGNNLIRKINTAGVVSTLAGNGKQGAVNTIDSLSSFNGPTSLALDDGGNIYVADDNNNRIRKISNGKVVSTLAGSDSTGLVNGPGISAAFSGPGGLCIDKTGNVYVADAGNNVIRLVTPAGVVSTYAGSINSGAANGSLLSASFNNPTGLALDASGNLYVADLLNNLIRKISLSEGLVSTLAGSGSIGAIDGTGSNASFYFPTSIAVDATGNVYVAEYVNNMIRKIGIDGTVTTFAGSGTSGAANGLGTSASFNGPSGVAVDAAGNVYVADTYNNLIRKITPAGMVSTIAGSGNAGAANGKALAIHQSVNALSKVYKAESRTLFNAFVKKRVQ